MLRMPLELDFAYLQSQRAFYLFFLRKAQTGWKVEKLDYSVDWGLAFIEEF